MPKVKNSYELKHFSTILYIRTTSANFLCCKIHQWCCCSLYSYTFQSQTSHDAHASW